MGGVGLGLDELQHAYRFLSLNYDSGDEIYLSGSVSVLNSRSLRGCLLSGLLTPNYQGSDLQLT